jgi:hypothetical protein
VLPLARPLQNVNVPPAFREAPKIDRLVTHAPLWGFDDVETASGGRGSWRTRRAQVIL